MPDRPQVSRRTRPMSRTERPSPLVVFTLPTTLPTASGISHTTPHILSLGHRLLPCTPAQKRAPQSATQPTPSPTLRAAQMETTMSLPPRTRLHTSLEATTSPLFKAMSLTTRTTPRSRLLQRPSRLPTPLEVLAELPALLVQESSLLPSLALLRWSLSSPRAVLLLGSLASQALGLFRPLLQVSLGQRSSVRMGRLTARATWSLAASVVLAGQVALVLPARSHLRVHLSRPSPRL